MIQDDVMDGMVIDNSGDGSMAGAILRLALLAGLLALPSTSAPAADAAWTIQSFERADSLATRELTAFADRLLEQTGGRLELQILPAGAVVPNDETLRAINAGLLQGHYNTPSYFARLDPAFAVLGDTLSAYPYPAARDRWFRDGGGLELARRLYAKNGLYFIGPVYWPPDWMPAILSIGAVEDLQGLRIRAPGGLVGDLLREAGSDVVRMPTGQIRNALLSGEIDGADWADIAVNRSSGLYDVATHNVLMRHSMVLTEISVGLAAWESLPDDLKALVELAVGDLNYRMRSAFAEEEDEAKAAIAAEGVISVEWDDEEAAKFREKLVSVWSAWRTKSAFAAELIDSHMTYMRKAGLP